MKKILYATAQKGQIDETNRLITGVIGSTGALDRQGESLNPDGWDFDNFLKNPVILYAHDYTSLPIGRAEKVWVKDGQLFFNIKFADTTFANEVFKLFLEGMLNAVSVGFIPLEFGKDGGFTYTKQELLELSVVPVPANPEALARVATTKGVKALQEVEDKYINKKSVVAFEETPTMEKEAEWNEQEAVERIQEFSTSEVDGEAVLDFDTYARGFAFVRVEDLENLDSYLLPHHDVVDGELRVNFNGVKASMQAFLDNMDNYPEEEHEELHSHLASHYAQFEEEAPALPTEDVEEEPAEVAEEEGAKTIKKDVGEVVALADVISYLHWIKQAFEQNDVSEESVNKLAEALNLLLEVVKLQAETGKKEVTALVKSGRVISKKNENKIRDAVTALTEVLDTLEKEEEKSNTPEEDSAVKLLKQIKGSLHAERKTNNLAFAELRKVHSILTNNSKEEEGGEK